MAKEINYSQRKTVWSVLLTFFIILLCLAVILIAFPLSTYIPRSGIKGTDYNSDIVKANPLIHEETSVIANRGGSAYAPENTLLAFKTMTATYGTEAAVQMDVRVTKEGNLVVISDENLVRTSENSDKKFLVSEHTVSEMKQFNMGYNFQENGEYVYRNADAETLADLRILTLNEALSYFNDYATEQGKTIQDINFYISIKDSGDLGIRAANRVYSTLLAYGITANTVVEALSDTVAVYIDGMINQSKKRVDKRMIRTASEYEIWEFYFNAMFNLDLSKKEVGYQVLSLPYRDYVVNFAKSPIVDYAHKYGIAVDFWTVNGKVDIAYVSSCGADAVITDNTGDALRMLN